MPAAPAPLNPLWEYRTDPAERWQPLLAEMPAAPAAVPTQQRYFTSMDEYVRARFPLQERSMTPAQTDAAQQTALEEAVRAASNRAAAPDSTLSPTEAALAVVDAFLAARKRLTAGD